MPRTPSIALALVLALALASCGGPAGSNAPTSSADPVAIEITEGPPRIVIAEPTWDFGTISQGQRLRHVFLAQNGGSEPLVIEEVTSACGCAVPTFSTAPIAPGQAGKITVEFDATGRRGDEKNVVTVRSNDPARERVSITVMGFVNAPPAPAVQSESRRVDFGLLADGAELAHEVEIHNAGEAPLILDGIEVRTRGVAGLVPKTVPGFHADVVDSVIPPGEVGKVRLSMNVEPATPGGLLWFSAYVLSNDPVVPAHEILCVGYIDRPASASISSVRGVVDVGIVRSPEQLLGSIPLHNRGGKRATLIALQAPRTDLAFPGAEGVVVEPHSTHALEIHSARRLRPGTFQHRVVLFFEEEGTGERSKIELALSGHVVE